MAVKGCKLESSKLICTELPNQAGMAELADAADSKSADLRVMGVRPPLPAPELEPKISLFIAPAAISVHLVWRKLLVISSNI